MRNHTLKVKNISKLYDGAAVLKNVSFELQSGEIMGILGSNASAKTTLLQILGGVVEQDEGSVWLDGKQLHLHTPSKARRRGILGLHENALPSGNLSIADVLYMGAYSKTVPGPVRRALGLFNQSKANQRAQQLLDTYDIDLDAREKMEMLTPEQKQLVLLLRALVIGCKVLLIDNYFNTLDYEETQKIVRIIRALQQQQVIVLLSSQKHNHLFDIVTSIAILKDSDATIVALDKGDKTETLVRNTLQTGEHTPFPKLEVEKGNVFYECLHLCYKDIIRDVSLRVRKGEIVGVVGNPQSGKSLLAKLLCGYVQPDIGKTFINSVETRLDSPSRAKKNGIMLVSADSYEYALVPKGKIASNIALGDFKKVSTLGFVIQDKQLEQSTLSLANRLGVQYHDKRQEVAHLSAGNKQKIAFARAIYSNTDLYLIDEPTKNIDLAGSIQIYNIMNELVRQGKSIMLFTSDVQEALGMCDRLLVLDKGEIVGELARDEFSEEALAQMSLSIY